LSEKLKDPSKAAHEIIEVLSGGDAIRNDGMVLTAANKNPWYVLATIYGEQKEDASLWDHDEELAAKNRRAWNLWACLGLTDEERADREKAVGLDVEELAPHGNTKKAKAELDEITKRFADRMGKGAKLPRDERIDFSKLPCFEKMIFEKDADFRSASFSGYADFSRGIELVDGVVKDADHPVIFSKQVDFSSAKFQSTTRFTENTGGVLHDVLFLFNHLPKIG